MSDKKKKKNDIPYMKIIIGAGVIFTLVTGGSVTIINGNVENLAVTSENLEDTVLDTIDIIDEVNELQPEMQQLQVPEQIMFNKQ
jgi:hypothetical protein